MQKFIKSASVLKGYDVNKNDLSTIHKQLMASTRTSSKWFLVTNKFQRHCTSNLTTLAATFISKIIVPSLLKPIDPFLLFTV